MKPRPRLGALVLFLVLLFNACPLLAHGPGGSEGMVQIHDSMKWEQRPQRGLEASLKYPGISIGPTEKLRVDLIVINTGRRNEMMLARPLEVPKGWNAAIKSMGHTVSGIYLGAADFTSLELVAQPQAGGPAKPGEYKFAVEVKTKDGSFVRTSAIIVEVVSPKTAGKELELTTSYPVLKGPTGTAFEFTLELSNRSPKEQLFDLTAQAPPNWTVSFKPAYENKQISSLKVKGEDSATLRMMVLPAPNSEAAEYPVKVQVTGGQAKAEAEFLVQLSGTHKIKAMTPDGLLSLATQAAQPARVSFYVRNEGSAPQPQVDFITFKPENWKIEFTPPRLVNLKPGELKQVEAAITPAGQALVGDYSVAIQAKAPQAESSMEFRVTVKASPTWGWIGLAIVVLTLLGLGLAFLRFGRR